MHDVAALLARPGHRRLPHRRRALHRQGPGAARRSARACRSGRTSCCNDDDVDPRPAPPAARGCVDSYPGDRVTVGEVVPLDSPGRDRTTATATSCTSCSTSRRCAHVGRRPVARSGSTARSRCSTRSTRGRRGCSATTTSRGTAPATAPRPAPGPRRCCCSRCAARRSSTPARSSASRTRPVTRLAGGRSRRTGRVPGPDPVGRPSPPHGWDERAPWLPFPPRASETNAEVERERSRGRRSGCTATCSRLAEVQRRSGRQLRVARGARRRARLRAARRDRSADRVRELRVGAANGRRAGHHRGVELAGRAGTPLDGQLLADEAVVVPSSESGTSAAGTSRRERDGRADAGLEHQPARAVERERCFPVDEPPDLVTDHLGPPALGETRVGERRRAGRPGRCGSRAGSCRCAGLERAGSPTPTPASPPGAGHGGSPRCRPARSPRGRARRRGEWHRGGRRPSASSAPARRGHGRGAGPRHRRVGAGRCPRSQGRRARTARAGRARPLVRSRHAATSWATPRLAPRR